MADMMGAMGVGMAGMAGMDHGGSGQPAMAGMNHGAMAGMSAGSMAGMDHGSMAGMNHVNMAGMDHSAMGRDKASTKVRHAKTEYGPSTDMHVDMPRTNLDDPGIGLRNNRRRVQIGKAHV